jgi:hypothetical protein
MALYDVFRGFASQLWFDPDAAKSESERAPIAIETLPEGNLLLGDRLYCTLETFEQLERQKCFGFFRRWKVLKIAKVERIFHKKTKTEEIEDWIVEAGTGDRARLLRMIVLKKKGKVYSALTNILDPERLSAEEAVDLYPIRWQVERLFFDLKEVLNLHRFYAANPNGVAMQVYAAAIVHTAFRIGQAHIAEQNEIDPEELSPQKFYPRLSMAAMTHLGAEIYFELTRAANPGVELRKPKWKNLPNTWTTLEAIRVEHRNGRRRKRRFCKGRKKWKSFKHVSGGRKLI